MLQCRIVVFLSGLAHITLPYPASNNASSDEAWVSGGAEGLIVAVDTEGSGHITRYPLDTTTIAIQIPFAGGHPPAHQVLHEGPCHYMGNDGQNLADSL